MPPRFAYWTILVGGLPTAFRSAERDELMPTFKRLQEKHPDAEMRWFARGKLWSSPEEASADTRGRSAGADRAARDRNWRPGGTHQDPRQPYKDAKKRGNQERRQQRFDRKKDQGTGHKPEWEARPKGYQGSRPATQRPPADREHRPLPTSDAAKPKWGKRDQGRGQSQGTSHKPEWRRPKPEWRKDQGTSQKSEVRSHKPEWRGPKPKWEAKPRPEGAGQRPQGARPKWGPPRSDRGPRPSGPRGPKR